MGFHTLPSSGGPKSIPKLELFGRYSRRDGKESTTAIRRVCPDHSRALLVTRGLGSIWNPA